MDQRHFALQLLPSLSLALLSFATAQMTDDRAKANVPIANVSDTVYVVSKEMQAQQGGERWILDNFVHHLWEAV